MGNDNRQVTEIRGMSLVVKTVARISVGMILMFGVFTAFYGHINTGGGFAGGVIIALAMILMLVSYGRDIFTNRFDEYKALSFLALGVLGFLVLMSLGLFVKDGYFCMNIFDKGKPFGLISSGVILPSNLIVLFAESAGLLTIFLGLVYFKVWKGK
ncbi:MAG: MnhB domain-containing protein [Elusimicrobiota bacterium]